MTTKQISPFDGFEGAFTDTDPVAA